MSLMLYFMARFPNIPFAKIVLFHEIQMYFGFYTIAGVGCRLDCLRWKVIIIITLMIVLVKYIPIFILPRIAP